MSKKDLITIGILLIISAFVALLIFLMKDEEAEIKKETEFNKLTLLTDETTFLSISDAINKICEYATSESDLVDYILNEEINIEDYEVGYQKVTVTKEVNLITPFLDRILKNPCLVEVERIIPNVE